ncbi:MFS transporter [Aeromicrobium wangtongii]|uniref:MFS transporter n=1 Tax=Aeromicrobium wangtongii TaxID=2969247 RepID=UPI002016C6C8|nr:MFS transporter [Aeromicrobium wangtongii]MCL3819598.1 MFS transporter [Aeromicrobium wangtongii]
MTTTAGRRSGGLLVGACALIFLAMVASFAPTPLYPVYQEAWNISDVQVSLAFAAYPVGVIVIVSFLGGLSDRIGRRNTLLIGLVMLAIALLTLALAPSYPVLVIGRLIHGFASGLVTGAAAAALMESHPRGLAAGAFVNTLCLAAGMAIGPLLSGALAGLTDHPRLFPFLVIGACLAVPAALLNRVPRSPRSPTRVRLVQPIGVPRRLWFPFSVSAAGIITANFGMGVFGTFGAEIAGTIGWTSQTRTGWLVSSMLILLALAQIGGRRLAHTTSMAIGTMCATLGWLTVALGGQAGSAPAVVIGSLLIGSAAGLCLLGSAGFIGSMAPPDRRAEIYSAFLLFAFGTLGLTALGIGPVIEHRTIESVLWGAAGLAAVLAGWVVPSVLRLRRSA